MMHLLGVTDPSTGSGQQPVPGWVQRKPPRTPILPLEHSGASVSGQQLSGIDIRPAFDHQNSSVECATSHFGTSSRRSEDGGDGGQIDGGSRQTRLHCSQIEGDLPTSSKSADREHEFLAQN